MGTSPDVSLREVKDMTQMRVGSPAWYAAVRQRAEREWQKQEKRQQWEEENEAIRDRRRTPKDDRPRCGARCRDGTPCQARAVWDYANDRPRNGRCRVHGGLSTGPRTSEGKRRSREGARRGARVSAERRGHDGVGTM